MESAKNMQLEVSSLQSKLMGKGLFRRFLEENMAAENETEMACSSQTFVAAASLLIRSSHRKVGSITANVSFLYFSVCLQAFMDSHALEGPCLKLSTTLSRILYKSFSI